MTLFRVLHAEMLKLKRTIALKMVVLAPAVVVLLVLFMASQAPFSTVQRIAGNEWTVLARQTLRFWALLMMPLYITLETALVAGLDHSENQWKGLMARPVPRWTLYVTKLLLIMAMTAASTLVVVAGILLDGAILPRIQPELTFRPPVPWVTILRDGVLVAGLAFLELTIQHWVSLRWRSFSVAVGAGIVAMVVGFIAVAAGQMAGGWPLYVPWALPLLIFSNQPHNTQAALWIGCAAGVVVAVAGCVEFCRREVS